MKSKSSSRRPWSCPQCGTSWAIPLTAADPKQCPECDKTDRLNSGEHSFSRIENSVNQPTVSDRIRSKSERSNHSAIILWVLGLSVFSVGLLFFWQGGNPLLGKMKIVINPGPNIEPDSAERAAAIEWMKLNLSEPFPEVIHWWPVRPLPNRDDERIIGAKLRRLNTVQYFGNTINVQSLFLVIDKSNKCHFELGIHTVGVNAWDMADDAYQRQLKEQRDQAAAQDAAAAKKDEG